MGRYWVIQGMGLAAGREAPEFGDGGWTVRLVISLDLAHGGGSGGGA